MQWQFLGGLLQKEVEWIDGDEIRDEIDRDFDAGRGLGEDQPRLEIAERILLPIQEMAFGRDLQGVRLDRRPRVRRWPQPHDVRGKGNRAVILVAGQVVQGYAHRPKVAFPWFPDCFRPVCSQRKIGEAFHRRIRDGTGK